MKVKNIYPEEIELLLGQIAEIKKNVWFMEKRPKEESNKELIISVKVIPK